MRISKQVVGVIPPMMTPVDEHQNIDEQGARRLVSRCIQGGVSGIFLLGTMGEGASLVQGEKKRLIEIAVDEAQGRIPIFAGVSAEGTRKVMENTRDALDAGADYIVSLTPYFFEASDQEELKRFFLNLARDIPKPLIIYNNPYMTHNKLTLDTIRELSEEDNIKGIKDSGDFTFTIEMIREFQQREDFSVLTGNEGIADAALALGVDGIVPGIGTLIPERFVEMYNQAEQQAFSELFPLQKQINRIMDEIYLDGYWAWVAGQKYALSSLGLCGEYMTLDNRLLNETEKLRVQAALRKFGIH